MIGSTVVDADAFVFAKTREVTRRTPSGQPRMDLDIIVAAEHTSGTITMRMREAQAETLRDYLCALLGPPELDPNQPF